MVDKLESISSQFTRVSQIKDQLAAIGDPVEEKEFVLTTLNGFPSSWDVFVQGICARKKLPKFDRILDRLYSRRSKVDLQDVEMNDKEI